MTLRCLTCKAEFISILDYHSHIKVHIDESKKNPVETEKSKCFYCNRDFKTNLMALHLAVGCKITKKINQIKMQKCARCNIDILEGAEILKLHLENVCTHAHIVL